MKSLIYGLCLSVDSVNLDVTHTQKRRQTWTNLAPECLLQLGYLDASMMLASNVTIGEPIILHSI